MRCVKNEIDIDFIGERTVLTKEEEKALHDYFKMKKANAQVSDQKASARKPKATLN